MPKLAFIGFAAGGDQKLTVRVTIKMARHLSLVIVSVTYRLLSPRPVILNLIQNPYTTEVIPMPPSDARSSPASEHRHIRSPAI